MLSTTDSGDSSPLKQDASRRASKREHLEQVENVLLSGGGGVGDTEQPDEAPLDTVPKEVTPPMRSRVGTMQRRRRPPQRRAAAGARKAAREHKRIE